MNQTQTPTKPLTAPLHTAEERSTHARTLGDMFMRAASRGDDPALRWKEDGAWREMSYGELGAYARRVARGLIAKGIEPGDRVAILSNTRPEWTIADAGAMCAGAATAPIYQTNSPEECEYVLRHSDSQLVFCEDPEQFAKVAEIRDHCHALEHAVLLTGAADGAMTLEELCAAGEAVPESAVDEHVASVKPGDMATLVYTSGTTGPPKGCVLTHANWIDTMQACEQALDVEETEVTYSFLPLAHAFARLIQMFTLDVGGTLGFWQRDPAKLLEDLHEINPTHLPSVPRVFEKIFTAAKVGIAEQSWAKRTVFNWAVSTGRRVRERERAGKPVGAVLRRSHALADKLALSKVRGLFGDSLQYAITGAAPISVEVIEFFDACGVTILEGWGMSETTSAGTLNTVHERKIGTIGRAMPGFEMATADDGELLTRGPHVFNGYFKNPEATAETLVDGWLHTGDLGSIDDQGFVKITGRKKDIIITSSGKNVTPVNIENTLKECRWISEAVVFGDARPYLVALLTLDPEEAPKLAAQLGVEADIAKMAGDPRVREAIQQEVDAVNSHFARIEQIKRFRILDHDLTQAGGELTPTMKVKRRVVYDKYAKELAELYE